MEFASRSDFCQSIHKNQEVFKGPARCSFQGTYPRDRRRGEGKRGRESKGERERERKGREGRRGKRGVKEGREGKRGREGKKEGEEKEEGRKEGR
ncbi:hypothetical protein L345_12990, partial [Ophiophagus hannah]